MIRFNDEKQELLFNFLLSKGWRHEEAMHKMDKVEIDANQKGNFVAKFKDGTTNTFTVEHVPKFFEI
jgi:hypothetical protein